MAGLLYGAACKAFPNQQLHCPLHIVLRHKEIHVAHHALMGQRVVIGRRRALQHHVGDTGLRHQLMEILVLQQDIHISPDCGKRLLFDPVTGFSRQRGALRRKAENRLLPALLQGGKLFFLRQRAFAAEKRLLHHGKQRALSVLHL